MNHKKNSVCLKSLSYTLFLTILASCGTESYDQKMARYVPKVVGKNLVPEMKTAEFNFTATPQVKVQKLRGPASKSETPNLSEEAKETNTSNKKLYFLSLFSEYETIKKYSQEFLGPAVTICPNFHTSMLRHNDNLAITTKNNSKENSKIIKFVYDSSKYTDDIYVAKRPELLLPLTKDETSPKVIDIIRSSSYSMNDFAINELVHKALDIHLAKTYSEIQELCEYGSSDNYYIYENLITHIKNNNFEANTKNMDVLLKTTIFSNIALITSLDKEQSPKTNGRAIASMPTENKKYAYSTEVMARLNVNWANQYFDYLKKSH